MFKYLCVWSDISHLGLFFTYSMIRGVISAAFDHSGCRYNLQLLLTCAACSSAHAKSLLLKTITLSSPATSNTSFCGALNFFGERQTQSQCPLNGYAPDVSIKVFIPASCSF